MKGKENVLSEVNLMMMCYNLTRNWLQTIPGKSSFVILRVYGPLKPWIEKTWIPGEVALIK